MRILHIINNLGGGGAEQLLSLTLPMYKQRGIDVELLQLNGKSSIPRYLDNLKQGGVPIHDLHVSNMYSPRNIAAIKKFINRQKRYDLVHVHLFPAMYWAALALHKLGVPLVFTEHNTHNRRSGKFYFKAIDGWVYKKYSEIIAITASVKENLLKWIGASNVKTTIINNGIDIDSIDNVIPVCKNKLLQEFGDEIAGNSKLLLMTARFDSQKNHATLVEAMSILDKNYYLLLAGTGPLVEQVKERVELLGLNSNIKLLGFRTDILSLMKSVDLNILSSHYEGLSGVTLESLASNKPFLGSDVPGIQNVVPDERFLFKPEAPALAEKIKNLATDSALQSEMVATAKEFVKKYDIKIMLQKHIDLYQQVLNDKK